MQRLQGWEGRLNALIARAEREPYVLGTHDCFLLACAVVEALTGLDHRSAWVGKYSTKREALALIVASGGGFEQIAGVPASDIRLARRGDIVEYRMHDEPHLGVCLGARMALLSPEGLIRLRTLDGTQCWRIG